VLALMNGISVAYKIRLLHQTVTDIMKHPIFTNKKYNLLDELLSHLNIRKQDTWAFFSYQ